MLVISRNKDDRTTITVPPSDKPTVIEVVVVRASKHGTRLGFKAPKDVAITRPDMIKGVERT